MSSGILARFAGTDLQRKTLFIGIVFIPVFTSAVFMVLEAGDFYASLYRQDTLRGHWAGFLTEAFLAISAAAWFKGRNWLNGVVKAVMVLLFIAAVGGSSLKVITPLLDDISDAGRQAKLERFMMLENKQNQAFLKLLKGQKTNTAIAVKEARKANILLKDELKKEGRTSWTIWIPVAGSIFLRFGLQLAAVVWAHSLGVIWRDAFARAARQKARLKKKGTPSRRPRAEPPKKRDMATDGGGSVRPRLITASGGKQ